MRGHFITTKKLMMMKKNEVCVDCEKLFRTKTDLSSHRHSLNNQKDEYKCNHCEWIFSTKSNLKKHLKKINNGSQEEPNVPDNSNSGGTINIVYKCTECNEEYVKISSFRFFYILREYENKLYTTKL